MQVSSAAILTLATLATSNTTEAIAAPSITPTQPEKVGLVVPVTQENTPAPIKAYTQNGFSQDIASPETIVVQQFSQTPANNNSIVPTQEVGIGGQGDKGTGGQGGQGDKGTRGQGKIFPSSPVVIIPPSSTPPLPPSSTPPLPPSS
ncbi:hypothetical protein H6G81_19935, partial [Scytonema hofmannii FACHB-248]|nr:hypothetical protein [Scytonema hofmannii FACHB-248]